MDNNPEVVKKPNIVLELTRNLSTNRLTEQYRIVKFEIPCEQFGILPASWVLLKKKKIFWSTKWVGACGYDRGASGHFNYQLEVLPILYL